MKIKIALFAAARQLADQPEIEMELPSPVTVGLLQKQLMEQYPKMENLIRRSLFAVDQEYADAETVITESAEVALIPPVSGG